MVRSKIVEILAGLLMIAGFVALVALALQVSGLTRHSSNSAYTLVGKFDNIGSLKIRAQVSIGGVTIGRVSKIALDPKTFQATVYMDIDKQYQQIPADSTASILTQGILGSNYIGIDPGFQSDNMKAGDQFQTTHSALILETLIGKLMYGLSHPAANAAPPKATSKAGASS